MSIVDEMNFKEMDKIVEKMRKNLNKKKTKRIEGESYRRRNNDAFRRNGVTRGRSFDARHSCQVVAHAMEEARTKCKWATEEAI